MTLSELGVAVFGASGAGKTVLLSAFFQTQTQNDFEREHGYKIQAVDKAQGSQLLGRFYDLTQGRFPEGSTRFEDYVFDFFARGIGAPGLRIHWYDYPGRWWEDEPQDPEEQALMRHGLTKLGSSHVGILVADGAKYKEEGARYLQWLFTHFQTECDRLRRQTQAAGAPVRFPREWILALSKADLFPDDYTAHAFEREVLLGARDQLRNLSEVVGAPGGFGNRFMLLSSARVTAGAPIDPQTSRGLRTLAPAMLLSTVEAMAREAQATSKTKSFGESILEGLRGLVQFIDALDDFLPEKYQVITKVLRVLPVEDVLARKVGKLRAVRDAAIAKGDAFTAIVNGMAAALVDDEGVRNYFRNQ